MVHLPVIDARGSTPAFFGLVLACCLGLLVGCRSTSPGPECRPLAKPSPTSAADITAERLERRERVRRDIQQRHEDALAAAAQRRPDSDAGDATSRRSAVIPVAAETSAESRDGERVGDSTSWEERLGEVIDDVAAGDDPAALMRLEDLLAKHGRDPVMVHAAAVQLLRVNRPDVVIEKIAPIVRGLPPDARLDQVLGLALYRLGRFSDAETILRRSLELDNSLPLTYLFLGCTAEKLHKPQEARRYFEKASQLGL